MCDRMQQLSGQLEVLNSLQSLMRSRMSTCYETRTSFTVFTKASHRTAFGASCNHSLKLQTLRFNQPFKYYSPPPPPPIYAFVFEMVYSVALVRTRTIPTERPPPVGEVSANFCG